MGIKEFMNKGVTPERLAGVLKVSNEKAEAILAGKAKLSKRNRRLIMQAERDKLRAHKLTEKINELEEKTKKLKDRETELEGEISDYDDRVSELEDEAGDLEDRIKQLERGIACFLEENPAARRALEDCFLSTKELNVRRNLERFYEEAGIPLPVRHAA